MDAALLGLRVLVKLKNPPSSLHGYVERVEDQRLTLRDVQFLRTGKRLDTYNVHGAEIADIEVITEEQANQRPAQDRTLPVELPLPPKPAAFVDPAIVGFARTPTKGQSELGPYAPTVRE